MVVQLTKKETKLDKSLEPKFIQIVKLSFMHKRKTLLNNLSTGLNEDKVKVLESLKSLNLDENTRAESLGVDDFITLTEKLYQ